MVGKYLKTALNKNDNMEDIKHESYALVGFSRITHSVPKRLFGSNVACNTTIQLKIRAGAVTRDSFCDHAYSDGRMPYITVEMTPNQFTELITCMNCGDGVPCTITQKDGKIYEQKSFQPRTESLREMFAKRLAKKFESTFETILKMKQWLKGKPTKSQLQEIESSMDAIAQEYKSNIPYFMQCLEENMEELSNEAKAEFENWMINRIQNAGINALNEIKKDVESIESK